MFNSLTTGTPLTLTTVTSTHASHAIAEIHSLKQPQYLKKDKRFWDCEI